jgi:hypothetical protein
LQVNNAAADGSLIDLESLKTSIVEFNFICTNGGHYVTKKLRVNLAQFVEIKDIADALAEPGGFKELATSPEQKVATRRGPLPNRLFLKSKYTIGEKSFIHQHGPLEDIQ